MKELNEKEKVKLRNKAKAEIERLEQIFTDVETTQMLDSFKNKFNICESAYKIILAEYQKEKKHGKFKEKLKINMKQVPAALNFAGYTFGSELLNELFGSKSKVSGCKTVKKLRDSITHGINEKSVTEIRNRNKELFGYMDSFLDVIKEFDNADDKMA